MDWDSESSERSEESSDSGLSFLDSDVSIGAGVPRSHLHPGQSRLRISATASNDEWSSHESKEWSRQRVGKANPSGNSAQMQGVIERLIKECQDALQESLAEGIEHAELSGVTKTLIEISAAYSAEPPEDIDALVCTIEDHRQQCANESHKSLILRVLLCMSAIRQLGAMASETEKPAESNFQDRRGLKQESLLKKALTKSTIHAPLDSQCSLKDGRRNSSSSMSRFDDRPTASHSSLGSLSALNDLEVSSEPNERIGQQRSSMMANFVRAFREGLEKHVYRRDKDKVKDKWRGQDLICSVCETKWKAASFEEHTELCERISSQVHKMPVNVRLTICIEIIREYKVSLAWPDRTVQCYNELLATVTDLIPALSKSDTEGITKLQLKLDAMTKETAEMDEIGIVTVATLTRKIITYLSSTVKRLENGKLASFDSGDHVRIHDFEIIKPITRGGFGRVYLARKISTKQIFAIKVLAKQELVRKNLVNNAKIEKNVLAKGSSSFVVKCFYTFTSKRNLYIVMEYANGGDCYSLLRNVGRLDEDTTKVYVAETVLALEHLHNTRRIVHRDLKPDNMLISEDGHIKLADFGLSSIGVISSAFSSGLKKGDPGVLGSINGMGLGSANYSSSMERSSWESSGVESSTSSQQGKHRRAVGTPNYLAPEILAAASHGPEVDWWALGVITFEFLTGYPPFMADTPEMIFQNILDHKIRWPDQGVLSEMSDECLDLIKSFLTQDPKKRLGHNGVHEVKQHHFFEGIEWGKMKENPPVFVPCVESDEDISYFSSKNVSKRSMIRDVESWASPSIRDSRTGEHSALGSEETDIGSSRSGIQKPSRPQASTLSRSYVEPDSFSDFSFINYEVLGEVNRQKLKELRAEVGGKPMHMCFLKNSDDSGRHNLQVDIHEVVAKN
ncbi:hypothetical protein BSKO_02227 [Bryopsis sp. KO-2023]|nr:hypothetical protein BSKO_02227 [Bryopsis sp. KO-2023]